MTRSRLLAAVLAVAVLAGGGTVYALSRGGSSGSGGGSDPAAGPAEQPALVTLPDQSPQELEARLGARTRDVGLFTLGAQTVDATDGQELARGTAPKTVDTAGLLVARTDRGTPVGMAISVRSSVAGAYPTTVDYRSTAFALLAQLPGFVSPDPKQMAVLRALAEGPELQALADLLEQHAAQDVDYLLSPTPAETAALAALIEAVTADLEAAAGEPAGSSARPAGAGEDVLQVVPAPGPAAGPQAPARARAAPPALVTGPPGTGIGDFTGCTQAGVADMDGREGDGVCLSVKGVGADVLTIPGTDDVDVDAVNHAGRWGLLYEQGSAMPLAVLPARSIDLPGISKSLTKLASLQSKLAVATACKGLGLFGIDRCPFREPGDSYIASLRDAFDVFQEGKTSVRIAAADAGKGLLTYAPGRQVPGAQVPTGAEPLAAAANFVFVVLLPSIQVTLDIRSKMAERELPAVFGSVDDRPRPGLDALLALSGAARSELLQMTAPAASPGQRAKALAEALHKTLGDPTVLGKLLKALGFDAVDEAVGLVTKRVAKALIYAIPGPGWLKAAIDLVDKSVDAIGLLLNVSALAKAVENDDATDVYLPLRDPQAVRRAVAGSMSYDRTCFYSDGPVKLDGGVGRSSVRPDYEGAEAFDTRMEAGKPQYLTAAGRTYAVVPAHCRQTSGSIELESWAVHLVGIGDDGRARVLDVTTTTDVDPALRVDGDTFTMRVVSAVAREQDTAVFEVVDGRLSWRGQSCKDVVDAARPHGNAVIDLVQGGAGARLLRDGRLWVAWVSSESGDPISVAFGRVGTQPQDVDGGGDSFAHVPAVTLSVQEGELHCTPAGADLT